MTVIRTILTVGDFYAKGGKEYILNRLKNTFYDNDLIQG